MHTRPKELAGVWVCPILSWYHHSFDAEPDVVGAKEIDKALPYPSSHQIFQHLVLFVGLSAHMEKP